MKELIYQDKEHEAQTRKDIETSRQALQELVDAWNAEKLTPLIDYFPLMMQPQKFYADAVKEVAEVPIAAGRFQINKDAFLSILDVPVPNDLYVCARKARQTPYGAHRDLWGLHEGKTIVVKKDVSEGFIYSQNVYASTDMQKIFDSTVVSYIALGKFLNDLITDLPGTGITFGVPWSIVRRTIPGLTVLQIEPSQLGELNKVLPDADAEKLQTLLKALPEMTQLQKMLSKVK